LAGVAERCPYSPAHTRGGRLYGGCEQRASGGGTFSVRERPGTAPTLPRPSTGRTAPWRVRGCSSRPQPSAVTDRVVRSGRRRCRTMASTSGPGGSSRWAPAHLAARPAVGCTHSYQPRCLTESPSRRAQPSATARPDTCRPASTGPGHRWPRLSYRISATQCGYAPRVGPGDHRHSGPRRGLPDRASDHR
jgi:hypothetical protein